MGNPILREARATTPSGKTPLRAEHAGRARAVPQSRINDAVVRAIEATVAGLVAGPTRASPSRGPSGAARTRA